MNQPVAVQCDMKAKSEAWLHAQQPPSPTPSLTSSADRDIITTDSERERLANRIRAELERSEVPMPAPQMDYNPPRGRPVQDKKKFTKLVADSWRQGHIWPKYTKKFKQERRIQSEKKKCHRAMSSGCTVWSNGALTPRRSEDKASTFVQQTSVAQITSIPSKPLFLATPSFSENSGSRVPFGGAQISVAGGPVQDSVDPNNGRSTQDALSLDINPALLGLEPAFPEPRVDSHSPSHDMFSHDVRKGPAYYEPPDFEDFDFNDTSY